MSHKLIPSTSFAVDAFRHASGSITAYFLSHAHSDHYQGLTEAWTSGPIYCSGVTGKLIQQICGVDGRFVHELELDVPHSIQGVTVICIDANHCPGAVQFLFKLPSGAKYVHCGDMRYCEAMQQDRHLQQFVGADAVFLDTTYCHPKHTFPPQEVSVNAIAELCQGYLEEASRRLLLIASYTIGKEKIFLEVWRRCGVPIYISDKKRSVLRLLEWPADAPFERVFTDDSAATRVHAVPWSLLGETWPYFRPNFVNMETYASEHGATSAVGFVPTGWTYEMKATDFPVREQGAWKIHLMPYSEHSSFPELQAFVSFLRPMRVVPTVGGGSSDADNRGVRRMLEHFRNLVDSTSAKRAFIGAFGASPAPRCSDASLEDTHRDAATALGCAEERCAPSASDGEQQGQQGPQPCGVAADDGGEAGTALQGAHEQRGAVDPHRDVLELDGVCEADAACDGGGRNAAGEAALEGPEEDRLALLMSILGDGVDESAAHALLSGAARGDVERAVNLFYDKARASPAQRKSLARPASASGSTPPARKKAKSGKSAPPHAQPSISAFFAKSPTAQLSTRTQVPHAKLAPRPDNSTASSFDRCLELQGPRASPGTPAKPAACHRADEAHAHSHGVSALNEATDGVIDLVLMGDNGGSDDAPADRERHVGAASGVVVGQLPATPGASTEAGPDAAHARGGVSTTRPSLTAVKLPALPQRSAKLRPPACNRAAAGDASDGAHAAPIMSNVQADTGGQNEAEQNEAAAPPGPQANMGMLTAVAVDAGALPTQDVPMLLPVDRYNAVEHACWSGLEVPYLHIAQALAAMDGTKKRLAIGDVLANMFRSVMALAPQALEASVYLAVGKIAPDYEGVELKVGGSAVMSAIVEATGVNRARLHEMYTALGDLGDVAQSCRRNQRTLGRPASLTVAGVFSSLHQIAAAKGSGSAARKQHIILGLLRSCRGCESKYIVRTLLQNLRVGANWRSVVSALGRAAAIHEAREFPGKASLEAAAEAAMDAFHECPNLSTIVRAIARGGVRELRSACVMTPGIPLQPMLAKISTGVPDCYRQLAGASFLSEFKYDGQRAQIHVLADGQVKIFSRHCEDKSAMWPDAAEAVLAAAGFAERPTSFIVDSELVAVDRAADNAIRAFQDLSTRARGATAAEDVKVHVCVFLYDVMYLEGKSMLKHAYRARRQALKAMFPHLRAGHVQLAEGLEVRVQPGASGDQQGGAAVAPDPPQDAAAAAHSDVAEQSAAEREGALSSQAASVAREVLQPASGHQGSGDVECVDADRVEPLSRPAAQHAATAAADAAESTSTNGCPGPVPAASIQRENWWEQVVVPHEDVELAPLLWPHATSSPRLHLTSTSSSTRKDRALKSRSFACAADSLASEDAEAAMDEVQRFLLSAFAAGTEGLMIKRLDERCAYTPSKRTDSWLKVKKDYCAELQDSLDLVPIGAWSGNGRKAGWYSPFLLAAWDPAREEFQSVCRVMSGFSDEFYRSATQRFRERHVIEHARPYYNTGERCQVWFDAAEVWEIRGAEISISPVHRAAVGALHPDRGCSLRFPRFVRIRDDKSPEDASGPQLIIDLFRAQTRKAAAAGETLARMGMNQPSAPPGCSSMVAVAAESAEEGSDADR